MKDKMVEVATSLTLKEQSLMQVWFQGRSIELT